MIRGMKPGMRYEEADARSVDPKNSSAWKLLSRIVDGEALSVLLLGGVGVGKTHLMAATLYELERRYPGKLFAYWPMPLFAMERRDRERRDPIHLCLDADVVFLDDLGAEYVTEWSLEGLYIILDTRLANEQPLIVASNLTLQEIKNLYGNRILSRFYESNAHVVELIGPDRRLRIEKAQAPSWLSPIVPDNVDEEPVIPMPPEIREKLRALRTGGLVEDRSD